MIYIPPLVKKISYLPLTRIDSPTGRLYQTPTGNLPSVTTILSETTDHSDIDKWREYVGENEANRVIKEATGIGTLMHENLENAMVGKPYHDGTMPMRKLARILANTMIDNAWKNIDEVWGMEVPLYYPHLWAGTTDLVGVHYNKPTIMDYKNSRKPKTLDMISNYRMQCAAYALAHNELYGTDINRGAIFIMVRGNSVNDANIEYQEFIIEDNMFNESIDMWVNCVEQYYKNRS